MQQDFLKLRIAISVCLLILVGFLIKLNADLKDEIQVVEFTETSFNSINYTEVHTETLLPYTEHEIEVLAKCVQAEAGTENHEAQRMITQVILNRLNSRGFPNNLIDVIYEKTPSGVPQFSTAYDGSLKRQVVTEDTYDTIISAISSENTLPNDVLFFYSAELCGYNWVKTLNTYKTVEGTIFALAN